MYEVQTGTCTCGTIGGGGEHIHVPQNIVGGWEKQLFKEAIPVMFTMEACQSNVIRSPVRPQEECQPCKLAGMGKHCLS